MRSGGVIIHPELRALRSDDTPQRVAQKGLRAAMDEWRARPQVGALLAEVERFAAYRDFAECPALARLFEPGDPAAGLLASEFVTATAAALGQAPLGHVPLRNFTDGLVSTLVLARAGNATLSLVALDGQALAAKPEPVTADFSPSETWEHVLAGQACADRIERRIERQSPVDGDAVLESRKIELRPGQVVRRDAEREVLQIRDVDGCLVLLRLNRRRAAAGPTREYRLADGRLVHQAAGNPRDSRIELMMALLGRMGRGDAAPLLAAIAREDGSTALRWQALRECLALDTLAGFHALCEVARSSEDALSSPAGALRAQLIQSYPQLAEVDACPA
jgi:hypothetical protein